MASILVCSTPAASHVGPTLVVARQLLAAGHDVRMLTGAKYEKRVRDAGIRFLALPEEAERELDSPNEAYPERAKLSGVPELRWSMIHLFAEPAPAQLRALDAAIAEQPVDAIVHEGLFFGAYLYRFRAPRTERAAVIALGIFPLACSDPDVAPFGLGMLPTHGPLGRLRNRVLQRVTEGPVFGAITKEFDSIARAAIGKGLPDDFFLFDGPRNVDALLQFTVPSFEYPRSTLPSNVHFVGPILGAPVGEPVLPSWWSDLDGSLPVIHVSQGTIANVDLTELLVPTLEALADEPVLVVAATGGRPISDLGPLPANARAAEYLPYDALFPKLSAFVTNAGYGGLHYALAHGVPMVAAGRTEDKLETTARVAWSGAGINLKAQHPTPAAIRDAVRQVLAEPRYREASARIGADIAAAQRQDLGAVVDSLLDASPRVPC